MFKFVRNEANLKQRQFHLQSLEVLFKDLDKKKMPHPPSHTEKEDG
jgi:hypothetical protein